MLTTNTRFVRHAAAVAVGLFGLVALAACGDSTAAGSSKVSVLLTDAPGDVKAAVVTISEIDLIGSGGTHVLMSTPYTTDLLTLAQTTGQLVKDAVVPAGKYTQLRFVITGGYIEIANCADGSSFYASSPTYSGLPVGAQVVGELQMPSFAESGIKVNLPSGSSTLTSSGVVYLVDFNVAQSFGHATGSSTGWVMHPVITATDFEVTGALTVQMHVDPSVTMPLVNGTPLTLADFSAVVTAPDNSTRLLALVDAGNGVFQAQFPFLAPGSYTVNFAAPTGVSFSTTPGVPATATMSSGAPTTAAFTLTAASVTP